MNNKEFIAELAERTGYSAKDAQKLAGNLIDAMGDAFPDSCPQGLSIPHHFRIL